MLEDTHTPNVTTQSGNNFSCWFFSIWNCSSGTTAPTLAPFLLFRGGG